MFCIKQLCKITKRKEIAFIQCSWKGQTNRAESWSALLNHETSILGTMAGTILSVILSVS